MSKLLIVLGFHSGDAPQAEKFCDWCYYLSDQQKDVSVLLVSASDCHAEMQTKIRIAAEVAFGSVELFVAPPTERVGKIENTNHLFKSAVEYIASHYKTAWLWVEPDCVPIKPDWITELSLAYNSQPKRFMGSYLKFNVRDEEKRCLARTSIYPPDAIRDLIHFCNGTVSFSAMAGETIVARSTKSLLIQQIQYDHEKDYNKIRENAVLLHSDKSGKLIKHYMDTAKPGEVIVAPVETPVVIPEAAEPAAAIKPRKAPFIKRIFA